MSARAMGSATVSFGLVAIPVKLFPASQSAAAGISFNLLHKKCGSRLKQQYFCPADGEQVPRDDMVKGFEYAKGQYVQFTEDELEKLEAAATEAIDIAEFVPAAKVDPVYFEKAYYLGPEKGGEKPYRLLCEAMKKTGRAALARYAARGKQYLVLVRPLERGLVMQQLRYADEVRPFADVPLGDAEVKDAELKLAVQLVEQIATDEFRPEGYKDDVKGRIEALIARKVAGQEVVAAAPEAPRAQIVDLMEALKASLSKKPAAAAPAPAEEAAPPAAAERKPPKRAEAPAEEKKEKGRKKVS
jgi:DNA end-binding protein Ku